ncbi:MAG: HEAT repeat domain-containing protein [Dehalococcoidia bacterium]|nr:HEAT repeat domain-containing protein [Dehalococcoidia bacterium]
MKKLFIVCTIGTLLSALITPTDARTSQERLRWIRGEFELPPEIKKVANISELQRFLDSESEFTRMAAARRLGQLDDRDAVNVLASRFAKEPYKTLRSPEGTPIVKLEIVRTLETIQGEKTKSLLLNIANSYWRRGPQCKCKKCKDKGLYPHHDGDYSSVFPAVLKALEVWKEDQSVFSISSQIVLDENIRSTPVLVSAWELHLITKMAREGITTDEQAVDYLLSFLVETGIQPETYIVKDGVGVRTIKSITVEAVGSILKGYSESALSYLQREVKNTSPEDKKRLEALYYAIGQVRQSLKSRTEQKEKQTQNTR